MLLVSVLLADAIPRNDAIYYLAVPYHTFQQTDLPILRNFAPPPRQGGAFLLAQGRYCYK